MTRRQTRRIQQRLLVTYNKAVDLELALRQKGQHAQSEDARLRANTLRRRIDELRGVAWSQWRGAATTLDVELGRNNTKLQRSIRKIEQTKELAQEVVEALKYVDEAIATAVEIAASP